MRILYVTNTFCGPMEPLARYLAQQQGVRSVFMAERWPRTVDVPGLMRVRIPAPEPSGKAVQTVEQAAQNQLLRQLHTAVQVEKNCLRLRRNGFVPDVVYAAAEGGYGLHVAAVFPEARLVSRIDGVFSGANASAKSRSGPSVPVPERLHNALVLAVLGASALGITSSHWQRQLFSVEYRRRLHVIANGIDTRVFAPATALPASALPAEEEERVFFSCQSANPRRGLRTFCRCLPELLGKRPRCRVRLVSMGPRRGSTTREEQADLLAASVPPMPDAMRQRVDIIIAPNLETYVHLLQSSTVYVYLTAPTFLSTGFLEAMGCGALVLASNTDPVAEVVREGENGFLWNNDANDDLVTKLCSLLAEARGLDEVRQKARQTILEEHDLRALLPQHAELIMRG